MLPADVEGDPADRTPADNQTVRNVVVVGPDKKVKLILVYPMTTGRNFDEVLRVIDSLQLTADHKVATPVKLEAGRGRDHRRLGLRRRGQGEVPGRLGVTQALHPHRPAAGLSGCGRQIGARPHAPRPGAPKGAITVRRSNKLAVLVAFAVLLVTAGSFTAAASPPTRRRCSATRSPRRCARTTPT